MEIRRSKLETDIDDAKQRQLRLVCAEIDRQRKKKEVATNRSGNYEGVICGMIAPSMLALRGYCVGQCKTSSSNEEVKCRCGGGDDSTVDVGRLGLRKCRCPQCLVQ